MPSHKELFEALRAPFAAEQLSWRVGSLDATSTQGKALPYIDARDVQSRLDDIVGPQHWRNRYVEVFAGQRLIAVRCTLSIRIDGEWVEKEDAAYLSATHRDDASQERAVKGVYSHALKRAAVQWGVGRYLYDFNAPWIDLVDGKLTRIPSLDESVSKHVTATSPPAPLNVPKAATERAAEAEKQTAKSDSTSTPLPAPKEATGATAEGVKEVAAAIKHVPEGPLLDEPRNIQKKEEEHSPTPAPATAGAASPTFLEIKEKLENKTVPATMLRSYIQGPKGKERLSSDERKSLLKFIDDVEQAAAAAKALTV